VAVKAYHAGRALSTGFEFRLEDLMVTFIYDLFNDSAGRSDHIASKGGMIREQFIEKAMEASGINII
jgi:hypothetical protein